jgi:hypothetical protein
VLRKNGISLQADAVLGNTAQRTDVDIQMADRKNVDKMTENVDKMTENVDKMTENADFI